MSTIFGSNIHNTVKPWDKVERTRFMGFDVNSYTKDCFGDTFVMRYPSGDKEVDNRGVIHFTKDGCITLNNVIYAGGQCLNTVYEAHTGNRLNKAKDAEDFMITHADDPHLQLVYFHIYDSSIAGDKWSDSNSTGTGVFITFGSTDSTRVFSQHYFWNKVHYYRVVASTANNASGWIEVKDVHQIDYDKEKHKIKLLGIKNLSTSVKNESGFIGSEVSGVEIPVYKKGDSYPGLFDSTLYNDLNDKVSKCVDRSIYNFDGIVTGTPANTLKPISELLNYDGSDTTVKNWLVNNIENCEINWYDTERRFLLNLGAYQFPVTENIINDTNPDWDIKGQWYSMYGKPMIYGNTDNYQYNLYRRTFGFEDQSKNWRNGADNIYVICSEGNNTSNNLESLSYILLKETGVQSQLDLLAEKATQEPVDLSPYVKKSEFNTYADNWDSTVGLKRNLQNINNTYLPNIIKNFGSYVTKSQLTAQSYVTEAYLTSQAYLQQQDINSILKQYATTSQLNTVKSDVSINKYKLASLNTAYSNLYNSTVQLINSYNLLYSQVAYNTSMIEYLLKLHKGDSSVTPTPVTSAPTSVPTSAPITSVSIPITQYSGLTTGKNNVLWGNKLVESVSLYLNDESTQLGNTYSDQHITLSNINWGTNLTYYFDLVISSDIFSTNNTATETALNNDKGYKIIWPNLGSNTLSIDGSEDYIVQGRYGHWGLSRWYNSNPLIYTDINGKTISYYMYAKYRYDMTTTTPGNGSAYYTAYFQYVYPYLYGFKVNHGQSWGTTLSPIVSSGVKAGDSTQKDPDYTVQVIQEAPNTNTGLIVTLKDTWSHDNKYFVKYNIGMSRSDAKKFNSGEYQLALGLHACSPQRFLVDSSFPFRVI